MISDNEFFKNFSLLQEQLTVLAEQLGRKSDEIRILPVTKNHPFDAVDFCGRAGLSAVGENRVQEAAEKREQVAEKEITWELIGHLQSNKAAQAVEIFDRIQSVDSLKLARRLDRIAGERGKVLRCLIQVNTGADPGKFGFLEEGFDRNFEALCGCSHLQIEGLMTIAPLEGGKETARPAFARLRELADDMRRASGLALDELSMGMSGDWPEAVAEGSTLIRVGSALFGARTY